MTATEVKSVLADNRNLVISFFNENVKQDNFYTLSWFMTRILLEATASWARRKNVSEKEVMQVIGKVMRTYPQIEKGHVSNYQKAVKYFGEELANQISNAR
ncbi:hypothetical protein BF698P1_00013 [Bacteroides phage BF698P1]|nr:hypothetical protein BF698P1_00013 [Bacteroides phage BF698P1]WAX07323.1 hypothetical protein BF698P3_00013 [Bacteroides phage BF698P3]